MENEKMCQWLWSKLARGLDHISSMGLGLKQKTLYFMPKLKYVFGVGVCGAVLDGKRSSEKIWS